MWLNSVNDTKLPTYPKGDQVNTRSSGGDFFFFFEDVTELSKWYQAAYVPERGSSQHVVQKEILFEDVTELSKWYQAAYVPERGSSQHVVQKG